jgi:hypothetical protein
MLLNKRRTPFDWRGQEKVAIEWTIVCVSYNLKRIFALKNLAAAA